MNHSINMSSLQIDTKSLEMVSYHKFNNIKLSYFESIWNGVFPYVFLKDAEQLLDTLEYYCTRNQ